MTSARPPARRKRCWPTSPSTAPNQGPSFDHFINGHKSQIGLIERAEAFGLTDLTKELKEHDVFWAAERKLWGRRYRFGGFADTDPAVAELARMDDRIPGDRSGTACKRSATMGGTQAEPPLRAHRRRTAPR